MSRPLDGVRVLALEQFGAGPWGTLQLADLGAEIIKIEDPATSGDVGRSVPPFQQAGSSLFFETFNRGKRSVALNLRQPAGRAAFEDLVRESDAVFSNLRGDQPAKLRIQYSDLSAINRQIVCVSLSGFGNTGPRAAEGAYDATIQALAGWMQLTGGPTEPPTKSGLSLVDFASGYVAAIALMAGIWQARQSGQGQDVDLSLFETGLALLTYMGTWTASRDWQAKRLADSSHQTVVPFQLFTAADGGLVVACAKQHLWRRLCLAIELPDLADDPRFLGFEDRAHNRNELVALLNDTFRRQPVAYWVDALARHGVPAAPVNDIETALADPQTAARESVVAYTHPVLGEVRQIKSPLGSSLTAAAVERGPLLGESTADILARVCGYTKQRIAELAGLGAIVTDTEGDPQ